MFKLKGEMDFGQIIPLSIVFGKNFTDHNKVEIIFRNGEKAASALNEVEEII